MYTSSVQTGINVKGLLSDFSTFSDFLSTNFFKIFSRSDEDQDKGLNLAARLLVHFQYKCRLHRPLT